MVVSRRGCGQVPVGSLLGLRIRPLRGLLYVRGTEMPHDDFGSVFIKLELLLSTAGHSWESLLL